MKTLLTLSAVVLPAIGLLSSGGPAAAQTNFTILKSFANLPGPAAIPIGGVIQASDGWLYGTTATGGSGNPAAGTVYKVKTDGSGFAIIKNFADTNGAAPDGGVIEASDGNLYGTTYG